MRQGNGVRTSREMELVGGVVHGSPNRLGDIGFPGDHYRLGERSEDRRGKFGIGLRDQVLDADRGVPRKARRGRVTGLD